MIRLACKESLPHSFCHFAESLGSATLKLVPDGGAMATILLCIRPETINCLFNWPEKYCRATSSSQHIHMALDLAP